MEFLVFHLTKTWARKSFIICGAWKIMASLTMLLLASVWHQRKWVKLHMLYLVVTTLPKLLGVQLDSNHSKTSLTGSEHGLLKGKVWLMALSQCKSPVKTLATQLLLTLGAPSFPSHPMFSKRSELSGLLPFQTLIARQIKPSAISLSHAKKSQPKLNQ